MKLCNIQVNNESHLGLVTERGIIDVHHTGLTMKKLVEGADITQLECYDTENATFVADPVFQNILESPGKLLCIGLNYKEHARACNERFPEQPLIFSKVDTSFTYSGAQIALPAWEESYDYEAELVIVMGKETWNVSEEEAEECIFGYTTGNDLSCRAAQTRGSQWLIGKAMPGFGPCGPIVVTADCFDPDEDHYIRSYLNGELRQDSKVSDMIFNCRQIVSYASRYLRLKPGDLIFTGTPKGVILEQSEKKWMKPGDCIEVEIEGIGRLVNYMVEG